MCLWPVTTLKLNTDAICHSVKKYIGLLEQRVKINFVLIMGCKGS